jgi:hypothetical protein
MATVNLEAPVFDITVQQGKTVELYFAATLEGMAIDMSGYDIRMQVRASHSAKGEALINCTLQNSKVTWVDAATGRYKLSLDPTDTTEIAAHRFVEDTFEGVYDFELISPALNVLAGPKGAFIVKREVTR